MLPPSPALNEQERLQELRALDLLDTAPEERFDRLTRIARHLFDVPVALVSLVDADRQWFKSRAGLDMTTTPRDVSFCGHAILSHQPLVVPDTSKDHRFHDNPLVVGEPVIRFYAGHPLVVGERSRVGTLCLIDRTPREFTTADIDLLRDLARLAERELAAVRLPTLDEATGLENRRGFASLAEHVLKVCGRNGTPATLLLIELDAWAFIRASCGEPEGERALKTFAALLRDVVPAPDLVARLGEAQFAVLSSGADAAAAQATVARLQATLANFNAHAARRYALACHAGCAPFDPHVPEALETLLGTAREDLSAAAHRLPDGARAGAR